jgi:transposase
MNKSEMAFLPCGIEVSSQTLVVDRAGEAPREFPNTAAGHRSLLAWLRRSPIPLQVCMEATGLYGLDLALCLAAAGIPLLVANPRAVRNFARAMRQRSKTDLLDAAVLREYAARMPFEPWPPPSPQALKLMAIAHRIQGLTRMMAAEKNRLHAASLSRALPDLIRLDLRRSIQNLQRAVERLTREALLFIADDAQLARRTELLVSVPGIGVTSALALLAELLRFGPDSDVRQWVAYAGLDPRLHRSGTSVAKKPALSKTGNAHLRRALYMPALVASQHDPHLRGFYQHLLQRGKTKLQALVAVMRKLLHAIFGMFKHNCPYDGSKIYALQPQPELLWA